MNEILSDRRTVWVNADDGGCIARFSRFGMDIHYDSTTQQRLGKQCLACTHETPTLKDWRSFQILTRRHHNVGIGDEHMPDFIRRECRK